MTLSPEPFPTRNSPWDAGVANAIMAAVLAQGILLMRWTSPNESLYVQILIATAVLAWILRMLWMYRLLFPHRLDMNILMLAFGGLGMLLGIWLDNGGKTPMHLCMMSHAEEMPLGWLGLLTQWNILLMVVLPLPLTVLFSRCALIARTSLFQWFNTYAIGTAGMIIGMLASSFITMQIPLAPPYQMLVEHTAMLLGMIAGMAIPTALLDTFEFLWLNPQSSTQPPADAPPLQR